MKTLAGTGALMRLVARRDRILLAIWVVGVALVPMGFAASAEALYPTTEALRAYAEASMSNPAVLGMLGPVYAPTLGGLTAWRVGVMGMLFAGIPSLLLVIRHTRSEEDAGRRELLGATVVGRHAPLTAALVVTLGANLVLAALVAVGLVAIGLPATGSVALGLSFAASGWIFAAIAAVAAQLAGSAGAAQGISFAVFAAFLVLRVAGDAGGQQSSLSWLSWASPLGWTRLTRPFADERWWIFALVLGLVAVLVAAAYVLSDRRDLSTGLLPQQLGPAEASPSLRGPLALAGRLQRGMLIGWAIGFAVIGGLLGAVGQTASELLDTPQINGWLAQMGTSAAGDAFLIWVIYVLGQTASAYAILAVLKLRSEETEMRAEPVLAASVSRLRWVGSHLLVAVVGSAILLAALGLMAGLAYGLTSGDVARGLPRLLGEALVKLPAVWVVAGIAAALYGLLPRLAAFVSWAALALFLLLELGWEVQQVSQSVFDLSPFAHVHPFAADVSVATAVSLGGVAAALIVTGLVGFRRRDLTS